MVVLSGFCSTGCRLEMAILGGRVHCGLSSQHRRGLGLRSVLLGEESWCVRQHRCRETELLDTASYPGHCEHIYGSCSAAVNVQSVQGFVIQRSELNLFQGRAVPVP